jgi:hypothetical protein
MRTAVVLFVAAGTLAIGLGACGGEAAQDGVVWRDPSSQLKRDVPDARLVALPGAGHFPFLTREAEVLRELRAFVAGLCSSW